MPFDRKKLYCLTRLILKPMANFYCEYCGQKFSSVLSLTATNCSRHTDGPLKGRHAPAL